MIRQRLTIAILLLAVVAGTRARAGMLAFTQIPSIRPIDVVTWANAAYSLRRLSEFYSGPLIKVTRASDSAQSDIYVTGLGILDTSGLATFCGASVCTVNTWYDQSGHGYNATQTTAANQPVIWTGSAVVTMNGKPSLRFTSASANYFSLPTSVGVSGTGSSTINAVALNTWSNLYWEWIVSYGNAGGNQTRALGTQNNAGSLDGDVYGADVNDAGHPTNVPFVASVIFDSGIVALVSDGAAPISMGNSFNTTLSTASIGTQTNGGEFWDGWISEITLYSSALATRDRKALEWSQGAYYGITVGSQ